jgi:hypothetical protein
LNKNQDKNPDNIIAQRGISPHFSSAESKIYSINISANIGTDETCEISSSFGAPEV